MNRNVLMRSIAAILIATLLGCAKPKERGLSETIPAEADCIMQLQLRQLLKMAGCNSQEGRLILTGDIESLISRADPSALALLQSAADMGHCIDLDNAYAFLFQGSWYLTAPRLEGNPLPVSGQRTKIATLGSIETIEFPYGTTLVANLQQAWIVTGNQLQVPDLIDQVLTAADRLPLTAKPSILNHLQGPEQIKAYNIIPKEFDNPFGQNAETTLTYIEIKDRALSIRASFLGKGNAGCPFSDLAPINPEVLEEMPAGAVAYLAIGLGPNTIKNLGPLRKRLPFATQLAVDAVVALSDPEGGTLAVGTAPGGNAETIKKISLDNWLVRAMLPMGEKSAEAAKLINKFAPDHLYCYALEDALAITSYDVDDYPSQNSIAPPENARIWLYVNVPYRSQLMKALGIANGYELELWTTQCEIQGQLKVMGQAQYILPALIHDLNAH